MSKTKVSVSLDPDTVAQARELFGSASLSEVVGAALDQLIVAELERRHVAGYERCPPEPGDDPWAEADRDPAGIADDVDWAALYGVSPPE